MKTRKKSPSTQCRITGFVTSLEVNREHRAIQCDGRTIYEYTGRTHCKATLMTKTGDLGPISVPLEVAQALGRTMVDGARIPVTITIEVPA